MSASPSPTEPPRAVDVLGLPIRPVSMPELIELVVRRARAGLRTTACYANAHTVNLALGDARFRDALTNCELLYADGASVVWASRWAARRLPERITAADYFPILARQCAEGGLSMFLLGSRPGIAERAAERLHRELPALRIAGTHHGHFDDAQSADVVGRINSAAPDVLAVGMSSPRQEFWLAEHGRELNAPVRWCVGAVFDYLAGVERRAPTWMRRLGCEWLFRLMVDPVGKWRRYLVGNPRFVWNTLRWGLKGPHGEWPAGPVPLARG